VIISVNFSDILEVELVSASQLLLDECVSADLYTDAANDELLVAGNQANDVCDPDESLQ